MITIKRGDTLAIVAAVTQDAGGVFDLTGYALRSQVRTSSGSLVAALDVSITSAALGTYRLGATALATASWPTGQHVCDVEYVSAGGIVTSTKTFPLFVVLDVTQ